MAQGYFDFIANNGDLRVLYEYTQDERNNTSSVRILGAQFASTNYYQTNFSGDGVVTLTGNTQVSTSWYNYSTASDGCFVYSQYTFYDLGSNKTTGWVQVNHDANGNGYFYLSIGPRYGSGYSDFNVFCGASRSGNFEHPAYTATVALPQIDRSAPTLSTYIAPASTTSVSLSLTSNVNCDKWEYMVDNGLWIEFSSTLGTSASYTITGFTPGTYTISVRARKNSNYVYSYVTMTTVDLVAPNVTKTVSDITTNGFKVSVSSDVTCDQWQFSTDGSTWGTFSTVSGTSASFTTSGLSPNTTYTYYVRARKSSNKLYGYTGSFQVKTLGGTLLNSANDFAVDVSSPTCRVNLTVYGSFYHILKIDKVDGTQLATIQFGYKTAGTMNVDVSISSVRTSILNVMSALKTMQVDVYVQTYSGSSYTQQQYIGTSGPKRITITTSEAVSGPTLQTFTYEDNNSDVTDVTHNNQVLLQNYSSLLVHLQAATAKNGASITGYSLSIGDISITTTSLNVNMGTVSSSGNLTLKVTASDTRGYSATRTVTIKVIPYTDPRLTTLSLRRRNEIDDLVELSFSGSISTVKPSSTELNSVTVIRVRWKKTSDSTWGSYVNLLPSTTISGLFFTFSTLELTELDTNSSFDFEFDIEDVFGDMSALILTTVLAQGTPIVAFRKRSTLYPMPRVGINNPSPTEALDVAGNIKADGAIIDGNVRLYNADKSEYADVTEAMMKMLQNGVPIGTTAAWSSNYVIGFAANGPGTLDVLVFTTRRIRSVSAYCYLGSWTALQFQSVSCQNSPLKVLRFVKPSDVPVNSLRLCVITSVTYDD